MPTGNCPLIIAQYDLPGHRYRTEHWSLAALESKQRAHIFQLVGNADTFAYEPNTDKDFQSGSQTLCGGCLVGYVDPQQLEWLKTKLEEIEVARNKPEEFDCQVWVIDALRLLRYAQHKGVEIVKISARDIRAELTAEKERWETGEETVLCESLTKSNVKSFDLTQSFSESNDYDLTERVKYPMAPIKNSEAD